MTQMQTELDSLLAEDVAAAQQRERQAFDALAGPFVDRLVLYGAGGLGRRTLAGLRSVGIQPLAFADRSKSLQGRRIVDDLPVLSPEQAAARYADSAAFVVTVWGAGGTDRIADRLAALRGLGCQNIAPFMQLYWKYPQTFLPFYAVDLPHRLLAAREKIAEVFRLWSDDASRREFIKQLRWRLGIGFGGLSPPVTHPPYVPFDVARLTTDEVFVDAGAFDGDTIKILLARPELKTARIACFEPDPANFAKLTNYVGQLPSAVRQRIELHRFAVANRRGVATFAATGGADAGMAASGIEVQLMPLDEVAFEAPPTIIKMDIEGGELDAIDGARAIIKRHRPLLAICAYHVQDHLWSVPALIHEIVPDYKFILRPHDVEVWDVVCYGIPPERFLVSG